MTNFTNLELAKWVESVPTESQDTLAAIAKRLRRLHELENRPDPLARLERVMRERMVPQLYFDDDGFGFEIIEANAEGLEWRRYEGHGSTIEAALTQAMDKAEKGADHVK